MLHTQLHQSVVSPAYCFHSYRAFQKTWKKNQKTWFQSPPDAPEAPLGLKNERKVHSEGPRKYPCISIFQNFWAANSCILTPPVCDLPFAGSVIRRTMCGEDRAAGERRSCGRSARRNRETCDEGRAAGKRGKETPRRRRARAPPSRDANISAPTSRRRRGRWEKIDGVTYLCVDHGSRVRRAGIIRGRSRVHVAGGGNVALTWGRLGAALRGLPAVPCWT